jgi:hypothetical protein
MVDISITAASVLPGTESEGAQFEAGIAGAAITAGQALYLDSSTGTYKLADNNDTSAALAVVRGIALHAAASGQPIKLQTRGPITIGATVASGSVYVLSATAGGIAPVADLATGNRCTILAVGMNGSTTRVNLQPYASQAVRP